jgi:hypothetical protein
VALNNGQQRKRSGAFQQKLLQAYHILAFLMHMLMVTGTHFEVARIRFDPFELTQQLITLRGQFVSLVRHGIQLGALTILLSQRLAINSNHDGHHKKQETEFAETDEAAKTAFHRLRWFIFDSDFLVVHGGARRAQLDFD